MNWNNEVISWNQADVEVERTSIGLPLPQSYRLSEIIRFSSVSYRW